jgi:phosphatidylinositol alpha 1,6-mannosyltransferase
MTAGPPRVAFFTDSYAEANGVARLSRALEAAAARRGYPFLSVHGGRVTRTACDGSVQRLELRRGRAAFHIEHDLSFDPLMWRHYDRAKRVLTEFRPDVVHITGPSDVGQLGALLGHRLQIPMIASWHTNLHQYAALRSARWCRWLPSTARGRLLATIERQALAATALFYRIPRVVLAPNVDLVRLLAGLTGKPTHLMAHGVDANAFAPRPSGGDRSVVRIGFVGRLSAEKQVRLLATLHDALRGTSDTRVQFVIVGDGSERRWLEQAMPGAQFRGVLEGEPLARAYAELDLFVFPSRSETFGLAVLEAMASGVPVLALAHGGPRFVVEHGLSGWLARDEAELLDAAAMLIRHHALRMRLAAGARARAVAWSWDTVLDGLYDAYDQALHHTPLAV